MGWKLIYLYLIYLYLILILIFFNLLLNRFLLILYIFQMYEMNAFVSYFTREILLKINIHNLCPWCSVRVLGFKNM